VADLASPAELRSYVQIPDLPDDACSLALAGISGLVRGYTGRAFAPVAGEVGRLDGSGSRSLLLPKLPVVDVTDVVEDPDGGARALAVGSVVEWSTDGILRRLDGGIFARRLRWYVVTYDHGDATADELARVKLIVLRIAARALVNPEGLTQENVSGYGSTFGFDETRLATLAGPDRRELDEFRVLV
jgi:hypothetical protein